MTQWKAKFEQQKVTPITSQRDHKMYLNAKMKCMMNRKRTGLMMQKQMSRKKCIFVFFIRLKSHVPYSNIKEHNESAYFELKISNLGREKEEKGKQV